MEKQNFNFKLIDLPLVSALLICLAMVGLLGFLDRLTGTELSFSIFYLVPITLAVLINGRNLGFFISAACSITWFFADFTTWSTYSTSYVPFWNAGVRLGYFTLHCFLLARLLKIAAVARELSLYDPLTKAANWRFFQEYAIKALKIAIREQHPVTVAFFDLDNFKALNDKLGHSAGDQALQLVAETVRGNIRPEDMFARLGGDEFCLLVPGPDFTQAHTMLIRLHEAISSALRAREFAVTVSLGAMTFPEVTGPLDTLIAKADSLMYEVKESGKNAVRHTRPEP